MLHQDVTGAIIKCFYSVYNTLGAGFLEKVYENALGHMLREEGVNVHQQAPISVHFHGANVGNYYADLLVAEKVVVELKTAARIVPEHTAQLLNYLKATDIEVGLLLNFGPEASYKRVILTNDRKGGRT